MNKSRVDSWAEVQKDGNTGKWNSFEGENAFNKKLVLMEWQKFPTKQIS